MTRPSSVVGDAIGWVGLLMVLLCSSVVAAAAQEAGQKPMPQMNMDHRGALQGRVRDGGGAAVGAATVQAVNMENGAVFTATTDEQGNYSFGALPPGKYEVSISRNGVPVYRQRGTNVTMDQTARLDINLDAAAASQAAELERQDLLNRIATLEQRISDLESTAVLSEPETRVRRVEVFVDESGAEHDEQVPGTKPAVTYRRERTYRRQTISEKIDEALEDAASRSVSIGVDAAVATQFAARTRGDLDPNNGAYALASADLFFTAGIAQNTLFFADIVGLSGAPPDSEIGTLTLINGYTARLVNQNELNLREAWLRTEVWKNRLAFTAGRLDLTNYFDSNALANDESTQFISDALVNNQMLGLAVNGVGAAAEFDPKNGFRLKFGFQQSSEEPTSLGDSLFTLSEVGYTLTPFNLPEGNYRLWFRTDNGTPDEIRKGLGISVDQKLSPAVGVFGRYGQSQTDIEGEYDRFYSVGVGFSKGLIFNPEDMWGLGFARMDLVSGDQENLVEGYYNLLLTEKLRLSFHLTGVLDTPAEGTRFGYVFPGIRFQAAF